VFEGIEVESPRICIFIGINRRFDIFFDNFFRDAVTNVAQIVFLQEAYKIRENPLPLVSRSISGSSLFKIRENC